MKQITKSRQLREKLAEIEELLLKASNEIDEAIGGLDLWSTTSPPPLDFPARTFRLTVQLTHHQMTIQDIDTGIFFAHKGCEELRSWLESLSKESFRL